VNKTLAYTPLLWQLPEGGTWVLRHVVVFMCVV